VQDQRGRRTRKSRDRWAERWRQARIGVVGWEEETSRDAIWQEEPCSNLETEVGGERQTGDTGKQTDTGRFRHAVRSVVKHKQAGRRKRLAGMYNLLLATTRSSLCWRYKYKRM
jgi:hypothetical protein